MCIRDRLLDAHLQRWTDSALLLGMATPPNKKKLLPLINEAIERLNLVNGQGALRLNWSRGNSTNRGIKILQTKEKTTNHLFWLELNQYNPSFSPVSTMISTNETRNPSSHLSHCKTFAYLQSIYARYESNLAGFDDALLASTNGEISSGTTSNLLIKRRGEWLTPRKESGCLPGIMRQQGINRGIFKEAVLSPKPEHKDQWLLINSLNCQPISSVSEHSLEISLEAEALWHLLRQDIH